MSSFLLDLPDLTFVLNRKLSQNELTELPGNFLDGASRLTSLKLDGNMLNVRLDETSWVHSFCSGCSRLNLLAMDDNYRAELPTGFVAGFDAWTREPRPLGMLAPPPAEALAMMTVGDQERFDEGEMARIGGLPAWDDLAWAAWVRQR